MTMLDSIRSLHPRSLVHLVEPLQRLVEGKLWAKILVGLVLGVGTGLLLGPNAGFVDPDTALVISDWLALPGQIFLGVIQMIVVPLVFASIIRGLAASESIDQLRKLGVRVGIYFVATTAIAVCLGLLVGFVLEPGSYVDSEQLAHVMATSTDALAQAGAPLPPRTAPELVESLLPTNPLGSMVEGEMLQIVLFAIFIGVALIALPADQAQPLLALLGSLQAVCMKVVAWAMLLAPLAVFGLLAKITASLGFDALLGLGIYVASVIAGLALLMLLYLAIAWFVGGKSPAAFVRAAREVQLLGFSTSSSAAVMPLSIKTAEEKLGVRPSIAQFMIPLGATINMDGTALYQAVATVFLAQVTGVDLSTGAIALIVVTTVGASIGAPSAPGVGIVLLAMVLTSAGIPPQAIALIIGVDRILDMSRTAVNVTGDLTACLVMDRWVGGERTAEDERRAQQVAEEKRAESGVDVLIDPPAGV